MQMHGNPLLKIRDHPQEEKGQLNNLPHLLPYPKIQGYQCDKRGTSGLVSTILHNTSREIRDRTP